MAGRVKTITLRAFDADSISVSQTPAAGGAQLLTLTGAETTVNPLSGVANNTEWLADVGRIIGITSAADETSRTFTIVGEGGGAALTEVVTGVDTAVASSTNLFTKITSITVDADTTGAITIGTTNALTTPWVPMNLYQTPFNVSFSVSFKSATATITVQHTLEDIQDSTITPNVFNHEVVVTKTTSQDHNYAFPIRAIRMDVTGFTAGTLEFSILQSGVA